MALCATLPLARSARSFTTRVAQIQFQLFQRGIKTTTPAQVAPSLVARDGGNQEPPQCGINVDTPVRMDTASPPPPGDDFPVAMIGAGNIMFGSKAGPWNHSFRIEHKLGPRLKVAALIDPDEARAKAVLATKCASFVNSAYKDTQVFPNLGEYVKSIEAGGPDPRAIIVGTPPEFRGGVTGGRNLELELLKYFPSVGYFIEKPVSTAPIGEVKEVAAQLAQNNNVVSVGYMLRYLRCVQKMKQIIHDNKLTIMATNARYSAAYQSIDKPAWWDKSKDMGPVIEQGTHFCDLSRYFGGDVDIPTVVAYSVENDEAAGKLSAIPVNEDAIPPDQRIPRITSAVWKYVNGAVGSFTHTVALQGTLYDCELEIWADGYHMRLIDPYNAPQLLVRRPGDDHSELHQFNDDDPFFSEMSSFIDAVEGKPGAHILSSFEDATKTYELTWAIRLASEKSAEARRAAGKA
ncbi:hypothetical protein CcaverHIS002_0402140 [Cutaneotrichosporon cavernicola]|uniref:NAD binding dehydrogenase n=1 Tax=Cutaneotrichosporon cavernicola TaxID=279322 RepID=A0AA48L3Q5_9TREE|nr:uncharacterized protein CcaverHIS019_0402100 [Cutaneotrichosporon cavernicola]BEI83610.1 hypothetical protein CcaverHIS002_0402140 [Cutaneotrichosporon cavernicola]BEI91390.1 hypothetical protein CcaverHIS019_0402100 [Cutaneotrichosporon cavernicola]BEI99164.1 hypothetical protein CcaverHIS631_0402070 [Cutaneotrichosporon cavernicola]BEJ06940.1 hypothetical protein CcaverHIS641_0402090 [Cutaneotrichosporon cavernicola]